MTTEPTEPARMHGVAMGLLILFGTVVFMTVFTQLYAILGVGVPYIGLLFVLVATIPELDVRTNVSEMLKSLLLAATFMGLASWGLRLVAARSAHSPAVETA